MIPRVHHAQITIPSGAEGAARDFYVSFLGVQEIPKPATLAGKGGFWLQAGAVQVHVSIEDGTERARTKAHLGWAVDDLEGWRRRLAERGIKAEDGSPIPGMSRFEFRDPFGNRVEFLQEGAAK